MRVHAFAVGFVHIHKTVYLVVIGRGRYIVSVLAVLKVSVFAVAEAGLAGHLHGGEVVEGVAAE